MSAQPQLAVPGRTGSPASDLNDLSDGENRKAGFFGNRRRSSNASADKRLSASEEVLTGQHRRDSSPSLGSRLFGLFGSSKKEEKPAPVMISTIEEYPDLPLRLEPPLPHEGAILTLELANSLRSKMLSRYRFNNVWTLQYRLSKDGSSFQSMYQRVAKQGPTIWLIRATDAPGLLVGAFVPNEIRKPGWSVRDGEYYYGSGEGFMFEVVRGTGQLRICHATLRNAHFIATLPDAIIFGGSGGDPYASLSHQESAASKASAEGIALQLSSEFIRAWSEGQCPTFDLGGIPLGCARDANGKPTGVMDYGDRGIAFGFGVADVEVWSLRFGRENATSPLLVGGATDV